MYQTPIKNYVSAAHISFKNNLNEIIVGLCVCFACSCRCSHAVSVTRVRENRFLRTGEQATQKKIVANFLAVAS